MRKDSIREAQSVEESCSRSVKECSGFEGSELCAASLDYSVLTNA